MYKNKIIARLNYLEKFMLLHSIDSTVVDELISDLFVKTFEDLAKIKNVTRRKIYIILIAKKYKVNHSTALDILEDNGLFVALPVDNNLIKSVRELL